MSKQSDLISVSQGAAGDPLFIDTANNRVGVGTSSPARTLSVNGNLGVGSGSVETIITSNVGEGIIRTQTNHPLSFGTNTLERMRIDTAGRITMPYQPAFDVASNAGVTNAVQTYNVVYLNRGSHFSTGTSRFTAPVAGVYYFNATTIKAGSDTTAVTRVYLRINGSVTYGSRHVRTSEGSSYGTNGVGSWTVNLSVNDYVEVYIGQFGSHASVEYTYFNGHLIG